MNGFLKKTEEINTRGIGLGLHICRELVRKLGGDIICQSEWQKGSTFTFVVKVQLPDEDEELQDKFERIVNPNQKRLFPLINIKKELAIGGPYYKESESESSDQSIDPIGSKTAHDVKNKKDELSLSDGLEPREVFLKKNSTLLSDDDNSQESISDQDYLPNIPSILKGRP